VIDFSIVGPIVFIMALGDLILHLQLDLRKVRSPGEGRFQEPSTTLPMYAMVMVVISTLLAFLIVFLIPVAWALNIGTQLFHLFIPLLDPPSMIWVTGFLLLVLGILLHGWSRHARQEMAFSWAMSRTHRLVTNGPYSRVRHPSYTSYFLSFLGLLLMLPSLVTLLLILGFPGYYGIALAEEQHLISHFGDDYVNYMSCTGRFLPV